jgi:hypothetical protein
MEAAEKSVLAKPGAFIPGVENPFLHCGEL